VRRSVTTELQTTKLDSGSEILSKKFRDYQTHDPGRGLLATGRVFQLVTSWGLEPPRGRRGGWGWGRGRLGRRLRRHGRLGLEEVLDLRGRLSITVTCSLASALSASSPVLSWNWRKNSFAVL